MVAEDPTRPSLLRILERLRTATLCHSHFLLAQRVQLVDRTHEMALLLWATLRPHLIAHNWECDVLPSTTTWCDCVASCVLESHFLARPPHLIRYLEVLKGPGEVSTAGRSPSEAFCRGKTLLYFGLSGSWPLAVHAILRHSTPCPYTGRIESTQFAARSKLAGRVRQKR